MADYMLISSIASWFKDQAVTGIMKIFFWLDTIIYRIAGWTYKIFYIMGSITLDADETVNAITNKVYTILLIFMVFVVAYNMLIYIINPDKIKATDDKVPTGAGNLVKKIAISLVVIVASPYFFDLLYEVQVHVVEYNVVGTIILGNGGDSNSNSACNVSGIGSSGDALVADVYTSFLYPLNGMMASDCCDGSMTQEQLDGDSIASEYCEAYMDARDKGAIGGFADIQDAAVDGDDYQYLGVVSTIAGAVMVVYFLGFCVYLGVRLFKLLVLELIAPIPALLDLVPGKSGTLSNWFKTVISVWAQVFVYQAIVFSLVWLATLVPGLLSEVNASINQSASGATNGFLLLAKVLLILGLFQACREVPKMVSDVLKLGDGTGILKAAGLRGVGLLATAASAPGQLIRGAVTGARGHKNPLGGAIGGITEGIRGGVGGLGRNLWGMRNAQSLADINNTRRNTNQHLLDAANNRASYRNAHGGTGWGTFKGRVSDLAQGAAERGRGYLGLQDDFDTQKKGIDTAYEHVDSAHIDDNAGKLGEAHKQRDTIQGQLDNLDAQRDNIRNEYNRLRNMNGPLSEEEQQRIVTLRENLSKIEVDRQTLSAQLDAAKVSYDEEYDKSVKKNEANMQQAVQKLRNDVNSSNNEYLEKAINQIKVDYNDGRGERTVNGIEELKRFFLQNGETVQGADLKQAQTLMEAIRKSVKEQQNAASLENVNRENRRTARNNNNNNGNGNS